MLTTRILAAALIASTCLASAIARATDGRPNVVLVTIDTLRADHVSAYGYPRPTTPFLDEVAARGIRYERAYSTSSWTAPAVVSLLTGTHPATHGVERGALRNGHIVEQETLPAALELWPELMQRAGYKTFGVTANLHLGRDLGFSRGFDRYECVGFEPGDEVLERIAAWRDEIRASEPYFLWLHFLDPHGPYHPRQPWLKRFSEGPRRWKLDRVVPVRRYEKLLRPGDTARLDYVKDLYDAEIRFTDEMIRQVLTDLAVDRDDLVVIASDHGEEFREHGSFGHKQTLYEESVRVPLVIQLPAGRDAGRVIHEPVSLVDVLPTILTALGVGIPAQVQGRDLLTPGRRPAFFSQSSGDELRGVLDGSWKLITRDDANGPGELYRLDRDPTERKPHEDSPEVEARLRRLLREHTQNTRAAKPTESEAREVPESEIEKLRSMGYVE